MRHITHIMEKAIFKFINLKTVSNFLGDISSKDIKKIALNISTLIPTYQFVRYLKLFLFSSQDLSSLTELNIM